MAKRVCNRLEIGFNNLRVKSDEWKKGTSSAASSLISEGGWRGKVEFVFLFFQGCSYQIRPHLAALSHNNPSLGIYSFSDKTFVSLWHKFVTPRCQRQGSNNNISYDKKNNQNAANLSYDLLFQLN